MLDGVLLTHARTKGLPMNAITNVSGDFKHFNVFIEGGDGLVLTPKMGNKEYMKEMSELSFWEGLKAGISGRFRQHISL